MVSVNQIEICWNKYKLEIEVTDEELKEKSYIHNFLLIVLVLEKGRRRDSFFRGS